MVCKPFQYEAMNTGKRILQTVGGVAVICLLLTMDDVMQLILFGFTQTEVMSMFTYFRFLDASFIFKAVKCAVLKVIYAVISFSIIFAVRAKFNESIEMAQNARRKRAYSSLLRFVAIPFFSNIMLLGHDVPMLLAEHNRLQAQSFSSSKVDTFYAISAFVFTFTSFSYLMGYVLFIPKMRDAFACKTCDRNGN